MQSIKLENYIPLKIIFNNIDEAVEYISYSKEKTSPFSRPSLQSFAYPSIT